MLLNPPEAPPPRPGVMVGITTWNQREDLSDCLAALSQIKNPSLQIVVVDNASADDTAQSVRRAYPDVVVIENTTNRGAAGGRNDLFRHFLTTQASYMMILDPDVMITANCFSHLMEEIERDPQIGLVGVKAYYADRPTTFWFRGGAVYNPWFGRFERSGQNEEDRGQYEVPEEVDAIPAGFTFIKRKVLEQVPAMDERYFIYFEESDWNFAVKKAGFKIVTSPSAKVYHRVSRSLGMESPLFYYYRTRNNLLFAIRHSPFYCLPVFFLYFFGYLMPQTLLTLFLSKHYLQMQGVRLGIQDFFKGQWYQARHPGLLKKLKQP